MRNPKTAIGLQPLPEMAKQIFPGADNFVPRTRSLAVLGKAVQDCRGCDLYRNATQAVFGEGSGCAGLLFVGEQPGNEEDLAGHPFVGPAGRILDRALQEAGIHRSDVYVTNAVKHFKFEERGKRRIHKKPRASEVEACHPWLDAEIELVKPKVIVCLGSTAAQALLGSRFRLTQERGVSKPYAPGIQIVAAIHPSAILRMPEPERRQEEYSKLVADLRKIRELQSRERQ